MSLDKIITVFAVVIAISVAGCTVSSGCKRMDECDCLGEFRSDNDCEDSIESCLDDLRDDEADAWDEFMSGCLEYDGCDDFCDCYWSIPYC